MDVNQTELFPNPGQPKEVQTPCRSTSELLAKFGKQLTVNGKPWNKDIPPVDPTPYIERENTVFAGAGEALTRIRDYATYWGLNAVAFLVNVCVATVSCVPPKVVGRIGLGDLNLNLFVVNYGAPGSGKGRLTRAAEDYTRVSINGILHTPKGVTPGSGEGICRMATFDEEGNQRATLIETGEITDVKAKSGRQGSTLRPALLQAYSGEQLGGFNKDTDPRELPEKNSYRLCFMLGSQKGTADYFFEGEEDGLIDRFVAVEAINPTDGERVVAVEPEPLTVSLQLPPNSGTVVPFPPEMVEYAQLNRKLKNQGYDDLEGSGHALETRAKLTVALAIVQSSLTVTKEDWERAGAIMDYSRSVFDSMKTYLEERETERKAKRHITEAKAREKSAEARWNEIRDKIIEATKKTGEARWNGKGGVLQTRWTGTAARREAAEVFRELQESGTIRTWSLNSQGGIGYSLAEF